jgi:F-type H+-transporting ATPase subunit a
MVLEETHKRHRGVNRWFVLFFIVLGAVFATLIPPLRPHIQVAPEHVLPNPLFGDFYLTNTMLASFVVFILLMLLAWTVKRTLSRGEQAPGGIVGAVELMVETGYNLTESTAGKWAKTIFPFFATIVLVVLLSNWLELIPGVDSIGRIETAPPGVEGYAAQTLLPGVEAIVKGEVHEGDAKMVVPFLRVPSTDLNFTIALALIAVVMTQVIGFRAQGPRYLLKFFNVTNLFKKPFFGAMDFLVGLLELISELSKLLSFSFRLFGNIFAGSVLIFIVGSMVPIFAQSMILMFEFFIGLIQAIVFGMLTMIFMSQATQGHGEHEEAHE